MTKTEYLAAECTGATDTTGDAIVLSLFGPKGGTIANAGMTREKAEQLRDHLNRVLPVNPVRALPIDAFVARAKAICDSDAVMRAAYAACEWDSLDENGREWIAAIVREAQAQATEFVQMVARLTHRDDPDAAGTSEDFDGDTLDGLIHKARAIAAQVLA
jgi:hypothetical protein